MSRNGYDPGTICHYNVFSLSCNSKSRFFKSLYSLKMVYAGETWHLSRNLHFSHFCISNLLIQNFEISLNCILNVFKGIFLSLAL